MERNMFDRILALLHEASLDDARWPAASALIDEACRARGNSLVFGAARPGEDIRIFFGWFYYRGQRDGGLEREYFDVYHPLDERVPRLLQLPDSRLVHVTDLYTDEELKTSPVYNVALRNGHAQNSLNVRLDGPNGSGIVWTIDDPVDANGWSSAQTGLIRNLLPHIRQYVSVRQALAGAGALGASLAGMLDTTGSSIIQLDGRGRIVAASDGARDVLRTGDGLFDKGGGPVRPVAGGRRRSPGTADTGAADLRRCGRERVDDGEAFGGPAAAGVARQPGGPARGGCPGLAGRGAGAGGRPDEADTDRSGSGRGRPWPHEDGVAGGGAAGRRQERPRDRGGDGPPGEHHPLAPEAYLRQARHLAAGGAGGAGAVAGRRAGLAARKPLTAACRR